MANYILIIISIWFRLIYFELKDKLMEFQRRESRANSAKQVRSQGIKIFLNAWIFYRSSARNSLVGYQVRRSASSGSNPTNNPVDLKSYRITKLLLRHKFLPDFSTPYWVSLSTVLTLAVDLNLAFLSPPPSPPKRNLNCSR